MDDLIDLFKKSFSALLVLSHSIGQLAFLELTLFSEAHLSNEALAELHQLDALQVLGHVSHASDSATHICQLVMHFTDVF